MHRIHRRPNRAIFASAFAAVAIAASGVLARSPQEPTRPSHWSLVPPTRPQPTPFDAQRSTLNPQLAAWSRNAIDQFVLARLVAEGLPPSPEADRPTLIRRVTLDLTGLPPTLVEIDAFLADESPNAYEKVVDRLLASPRFGERMASRWLDAARYADTNGYQSDGERFMWRWRDWVIDAFNRNMPFDQFTIEQLAGDMLPDATLDQKIATGFNRNHRGNAEGGIVPEEYAVEYVVDRVETTSTVWLGMTIGCARCHDHKFDPVSQREFYQLFAYFNNVPERGRAIKFGNSPPLIKSPTRDQQAQLRELDQKLADAETAFERLRADLAAAQREWEQKQFAEPTASQPPLDWSITRGLVAHFGFNGDTDGIGFVDPPPPVDQEYPASVVRVLPLRADDESPGARIRTAKFESGDAAFAAGRLGGAAEFDGERFVNAGDLARFGFYEKFSLAAWINLADDSRGDSIVSRMTDAEQADGYQLCVAGGRVQFNLVKRWLDDALRVETESTLEPGRWHHVLATYDGSRVAAGVQLYIDGRPQKLRVLLDDLNQTFATKEPLRIGAGGGPTGRFHGRIDEVRISNECLSPADAAIVAEPSSIREIIATPRDRRTAVQSAKLDACFLALHATAEIRASHARFVALRRQRDQFAESLPTTMVMQEMPTPRDTFILQRGQYDKPGARVAPGVPASLIADATSSNSSRNRLELARWLVDSSNPLTARVAVNRLWQMCFGTGLVKTVDDFGRQGDPPSHAELLDWLACEFREGSRESGVGNREADSKFQISNRGSVNSDPQRSTLNAQRSAWDIKSLLRLIVTSATYRQSSKASPELRTRDPENRLLARGPRGRLSAEMIRDQALAASGLLVEKLGGPSVRPYQPAGLWKELTGADEYVQDHGDSLVRRSLYTFWKRTVAPPTMLTFDAAGRETCIVRETRTNTPLQALTLMNDVTFVEAARKLAERMMKEGGSSPDDRITFAFRLATARPPRPPELTVLRAGYHEHLVRFRANPAAAADLLAIGESPRDESLDTCELVANAAVASLILNLDETVTKE